MSDIRRLLESMNLISEAPPKGMPGRPLDLPPIEAGGPGMGLGGGGRGGISTGIGQAMPAPKPRITRLPGETPAQAIARAQTTATPLPAGVQPSTAGAGRGTVSPTTAKPDVWKTGQANPERIKAQMKTVKGDKPEFLPPSDAERKLSVGPPNLQVPPKMQGQKLMRSPTEIVGPAAVAAAASKLPGGKEGGAGSTSSTPTAQPPTPQATPQDVDTSATPSKVDLPVIHGEPPEGSPFVVARPEVSTPSAATKPSTATSTQPPKPVAPAAPQAQTTQPTAQQPVKPIPIPQDNIPQTQTPSKPTQTQQPAATKPADQGTAPGQAPGTTAGSGTGTATGAGSGTGGAGKDWFTRAKEFDPKMARENKQSGKEHSMRDILEKVDSMASAEKKPTGPKFPGYWKGKDPASKAKSKMVGSAEESIIPKLNKIAENKSLEWRLEEAFRQFKEADPAYTGVDPIVRQRMGMEPATQGDIHDYLDKNPPVVRTGSGETWKTGTGQNVQSGEQVAVAKAADAASPDRAQSVAREPATVTTPPQGVVVTPIPDRPASTATTTTPTQPAPTKQTAAEKPAQSFGQAFAAARAQQMKSDPSNPGAGRFTWQGKEYHTGRSDDVTPTTAPVKTQTPSELQNIIKQNPNIKNPNLIQPGQEIKLPNNVSTTVDKGDTLSSIAKRYQQGLYNVEPEEPTQPVSKRAKKLNPQTNDVKETKNEKIAGRYEPDEFDDLVRRLGQKAKAQEKKHGPVDIAKLAKKLRDLEQREQTKEQEDPAVNKQDPDSQMTSQTSTGQDPAAVKQQQIDQMQDVSTAKSTMSGLSTVLGSGVNPNALSSAVNKISDGKPLTAPEATSMSALTPLIAKAAETPQAAPALKTALSNAALLAKQGK